MKLTNAVTTVAAIGLILSFGAIPQPAHAQHIDVPRTCGDLPGAHRALDRYFRYFTQDRFADVRDSVLMQLPATAPHYVVTDTKVCSRIMHAVVQRWRKNWHPPDGPYRFRIYRYGPYYAVEIERTLPPGIESTGYAPLIILNSDKLTYVTVILV